MAMLIYVSIKAFYVAHLSKTVALYKIYPRNGKDLQNFDLQGVRFISPFANHLSSSFLWKKNNISKSPYKYDTIWDAKRKRKWVKFLRKECSLKFDDTVHGRQFVSVLDAGVLPFEVIPRIKLVSIKMTYPYSHQAFYRSPYPSTKQIVSGKKYSRFSLTRLWFGGTGVCGLGGRGVCGGEKFSIWREPGMRVFLKRERNEKNFNGLVTGDRVWRKILGDIVYHFHTFADNWLRVLVFRDVHLHRIYIHI